MARHASSEAVSQNIDPDVQRYLARNAPKGTPDPGKQVNEGASWLREAGDLGSVSDMSDLTSLTDTDDEGRGGEATGKGAYSYTVWVLPSSQEARLNLSNDPQPGKTPSSWCRRSSWSENAAGFRPFLFTLPPLPAQQTQAIPRPPTKGKTKAIPVC
jgi:hypothetical protein